MTRYSYSVKRELDEATKESRVRKAERLTKQELIERYVNQQETISRYLAVLDFPTRNIPNDEEVLVLSQKRYMQSQNKLKRLINETERQVEELVAKRHEYPMWPHHGEGPADAWEEAYHGPIRGAYYRSTILLIRALKTLRGLD